MDLPFILSGFFANPGNIIKTVIDIAIVAYLIYKLLVLLVDTRAEQLLKGLAILLLFSFVVGFFQLDLLLWILNKLWLIFAIAIPVVFQPELRRILEHLGRGKLLAFSGSPADNDAIRDTIRETVVASKSLAAAHIGALIIMARQTGIDEFLESGKEVDAVVSAALLINIFTPNTPLHDGAVVIKGSRLQKAACFIPLSDNPDLDLALGTRHRAGIGITEVSDALVLIVSEETGSISLAYNGVISRNIDVNTLRQRLEQELLLPEHEKNRKGWLKSGIRKR